MFIDGETKVLKLKAGKYLFPVKIIRKGERLELGFSYSPVLLAEVKNMAGAKWHGFEEPNPRKIWSISNCFRNWFQLRYLMGEKVYEWYDQPLISGLEYTRTPFSHQKMLIANGLTYHYQIWAAEMGTGKSLAMIELMERCGVPPEDCWYIGPKSGVKAVTLELEKWSCKHQPKMMTYEQLVSVIKNWPRGKKAPRFVNFDESSKIKTPTAQRSVASFHLSESMRQDWGIEKSYCILMSGTPAPKSPVDWFFQAECACPGFLKEGDIHKFKNRLCLTEQRESLSGGMYPHLLTWLDDEKKCKTCGQYEEHANHMLSHKRETTDETIKHGFSFGGAGAQRSAPTTEAKPASTEPHTWAASNNEVSYLYQRLKGLVVVLFKKDCLDLPEKRYQEVRIKPTLEMIGASRLIVAQSRTAIKSLILLRELSDGFQYEEVETGEVECSLCHGSGIVNIPVPKEGTKTETIGNQVFADQWDMQDCPCDKCEGSGKMPKMSREAKTVSSPKDAQLINDLDAHEEVGRLIVWGGFQATIDRIVDMCHQQGWSTLRVDGRGYHASSPEGGVLDANELLKAMDASHPLKTTLREKHDKICFVGNAKAGGMALTLTASPSEIFYSNGFDGEARFQAEDRFHRPGADHNRGCTIYDYICLPSDLLVLNNLKKKRKLQDMSLGEVQEAFKEVTSGN